jgi:hypothetical protein
MFQRIGIIVVLACMASGCMHSSHSNASENWYRGNTHAHTELCGHADSSPEVVTRWYHDHGYNFLILSEHNIFIDPATVKMPADLRDDFILVPGEEITGEKYVHTTAMNTHALVDWDYDYDDPAEILQRHVDGASAAGGETIVNHPNWHYALNADHIKRVRGVHMFELYNASDVYGEEPSTQDGDADHPSTEAMWDDMLTSGMVMYGVASDDAHEFQEWRHDISNPGRGWVMVRAKALTPDALTAAMAAGDFYASSGVVLKSVTLGSNTLRVTVDRKATLSMAAQDTVLGKRIGDAPPWQIEFIGPGGEVLKTMKGPRSSYRASEDLPYVRCKVTYTEDTPQGKRQYFAWTQPLFRDGR